MSILLWLLLVIGYGRGVFLTYISLGTAAVLWMCMDSFIPTQGAILKAFGLIFLCTLGPLVATITHTLERRKRFSDESCNERLMQAARVADSILNHTLKNTMADAAGLIEMFVQDCDGIDPAMMLLNLEQSASALRRGMRACQHRQAYISLVMGTYVLNRRPVKLQDFLSELSKGRQVEFSILAKVPSIFDLDHVLIDLILDNSISNALKHGHQPDPAVRIDVSVDPRGIKFVVRNKRNSDGPTLTAEFVTSMFLGKDQENYTASHLPTSDRIGMQHIRLAAATSSTEVSLWQDHEWTYFQAIVPGTSLPSPHQLGKQAVGSTEVEFSHRVHICCIDDSRLGLTMLEMALKRDSSVFSVSAFGTNGYSDVDRFLDETLNRADIAILDQNLDFPSQFTQGTALVRDLKERGFTGLMCMRSGSTSDADTQMYWDAGCQCVLGRSYP